MKQNEDEKSVRGILAPIPFAVSGIVDVAAVATLDKVKLGIWYYVIIGVISLVCIVCFIRLLAYAVRNQNLFIRILLFKASPNQSLILKSKECVYTFIDRTHMQYLKKFSILSKIPDLRVFYDMYMWTKDYKSQQLQPINSDTVIDTYSEDQWQYYGIRFDEPCGKNKVHNTGVFMPSLEDPKKESQLFLSTGIFEPTVSVSLCVVIRGDLKFKEGSTFCKVYNYYYGKSADKKIPLNPVPISDEDGTGFKISFDEKYPIKNARYKLVWKFEGE